MGEPHQPKTEANGRGAHETGTVYWMSMHVPCMSGCGVWSVYMSCYAVTIKILSVQVLLNLGKYFIVGG